MRVAISKKKIFSSFLLVIFSFFILISILFSFHFYYNVLAAPWVPVTPPVTGPETPPGVIFNSPQPQYSSNIYHFSLTESLTIDPNSFHTFYTLDGSDPDASSIEYTAPIYIPFVEGTNVKLKAISYDGRGVASEISETNYYFDNSTPIVIGSGSIPELFNTGTFDVGTSQPTQTQKVVINVGTTIETSGVGGTSIIILPKDTEITKNDGTLFNANLLSSSAILTTSLSGLTSFTSLGAVQWGIPSLGLNFSLPITVKLYVGVYYNGRTLSVVRSINPDGGWTNDGIVSPATCTVSNGYCSFQATKASYYVAGIQSISNNNSNNSNNNSASSGPINSTPTCNDSKPTNAPDLFQVNTTKNTAKIYFTPTSNTNRYYISFSTKLIAEDYGGEVTLGSQGIQNFTLKSLKPRTTYYIKVRGQNGCMPGDWSNVIKIKTNSQKYYKYTKVAPTKKCFLRWCR